MKAANYLFISSVLALPIVISIVPEAKADLIVCNTSSDKAYIAQALYSKNHWSASGWTHVFSGKCETVILGDMRKTSAYIYAANDNWEPWQLEEKKTAVFCLQQSSFEITNADGQCSLDMIPKTFYKVVSPGNYDYTLKLR